MKNSKLQNPSLRKRKGFTLIELIVVIAILAILAALAVPTFLGTLQRSRERVHDANVRVLRSAASLYIAENPNTAASWNAANAYVVDWPENPNNSARTYTVGISTAGVITISPDTGDYS